MTKLERLKIYESFFHQINVYCITMNNDKIREVAGLIDSWIMLTELVMESCHQVSRKDKLRVLLKEWENTNDII